ncbi:hypothetical protein [Paenibacillus beijingensis]|nr:hypothetical protein [Paenibacillus beijingensis]
MRNIDIKLGLGVLLLAAAIPHGASAYAAKPNGESAQAAVVGHGMPDGDCGKQHADGSRHHPHMHRHEAWRLERLREAASYFGIQSDGKSAEQLKAEIMAMKTKDSAKWEAFKKSMKAKRFERLKQFAASQGISTEGKTEQQLRNELRALCRHKGEQPSAPKSAA